jgi:acyl-CoA reductase-like NAD-dependent aldehyde dehydrogenase
MPNYTEEARLPIWPLPPGEALPDEAVAVAASVVQDAFDPLHAASRRTVVPDYAERLAWLDTLLALVRDNQGRIETAIDADFAGRARRETGVADVWAIVKSIRYIRSHLRTWMRPQRRAVPLVFLPGRARVVFQPLGVVGVIAPWNYPFQLAIEPAAYALAAGNRVLLKPSEHAPRTAALITELVHAQFSADVMRVVTGGADVGEAVARLPLDHLLFTGSTWVGRLVMRAAAENLVPVTLEMGGKSPAIVHETYDVQRAARSICLGKWFNAGQTCIAPDYVLVAAHRRDALVEALVAETRRMFPTIRDNPDYTSIIDVHHYRRLRSLVTDAVERGAKQVEIAPPGEEHPEAMHRLPPTVLLDVTEDMQVTKEEIFGPVLPVMTYRTLDEAVAFVNRLPRALALYYFDDDASRQRRMTERTVSGGVGLNDVGLQFLVDDLPFGGVGPSGMGAYHGREGFEAFSHRKAIFSQSRFNLVGMFSPPYGARIDRLLRMLIGR